MGKKIILLSDGTGNSAAKVWRTNVWRVFESLELKTSDQIAFYDDGVGTSAFKPFAILGGVFGLGLKRNVLSLYKAACRNYKSKADYPPGPVPPSDDEIFAFGFSRGAFTIRVLTGLILDHGLVKFDTEEELNRKTKIAYRAYRKTRFRRRLLPSFLDKLRNRMRRGVYEPTPPPALIQERRVDKIRFLGLWDTVAAYGLPVDEMTRGVSQYIWPLEFRDRTIDITRIERACHALALDDERTTFHPLLWDESALPPVPAPQWGKRHTKHESLSQVWFAGVHANVGGGYPDDSLAHVSLNWIIDEAKACGLKFKPADPNAVKQAIAAQDKDGRLYNSRSGLAAYYRYGPRKLEELCDAKLSSDPKDIVKVAMPKIHESVLDRIQAHAHLYAPIVLPKTYEIVKYNGEIVPQAASPYERPPRAKFRTKLQERIWNLVWKRRAIYFLTVITSLYLATYAFFRPAKAAAEFETRLRFVSDTIRWVQGFLPGFVTPLADSYARDPSWFLLVAFLLAILLFTNSRLTSMMNDRMNAIWRLVIRGNATSSRSANDNATALRNILAPRSALMVTLWTIAAVLCVVVSILPYLPEKTIAPPLPGWLLKTSPLTELLAVYFLILALPEHWIFRLRRSTWYRNGLTALKHGIAPAFFALAFLYLAIFFGNHFLFRIEDALGLTCTPSAKSEAMRICSPPSLAFCVDSKPVCQTSQIVPFCADGSAPKCKKRKALNASGKSNLNFVDAVCETPQSTPAIATAPANPATPSTSVPAVCGKPCDDDLRLVKKFDIGKVCFATGAKLERVQNYKISIIPDDDKKWRTFGGQVEAAPGGIFVTEAMLTFWQKWELILTYPLKRALGQPSSGVILRAGTEGNAEKYLQRGADSDFNKVTPLASIYRPLRDGELFVYLNEPVFAGSASLNWLFGFVNRRTKGTMFATSLPTLEYQPFYSGNSGSATIKIERIPN